MWLIGLAVTLAFGLFAAPLAVRAQQAGKVYRIGYLSPRSTIESAGEALRKALGQLGYVEGQNLVVEWRFTQGQPVAPELAAELVRLKLDCIVGIGVGAVVALKKSTATIPIVIGAIDADPVEQGVIASFARPGGNVTGITNIAYDLAGKRLEFLKETIPGLSRVAILIAPNPASDAHVRVARVTAPKLGIELHVVEAGSPDDLEAAFLAMRQKRAGALDVVATGLINSHRARIINLAVSTRLPTIYSNREFVLEGGLMSYADDPVARAHRVAAYVDRVLKGAKPGDLPVEQPTKFELVINLKTAKALGLTIPQSVLLRADHVIQ
ncbi:MAG: ABC transporter substrate-binding protein [Candidatus Rokuibacteriota bacterium]